MSASQETKRTGWKKYFDFYPPVFIPSAIVIVLFIGLSLSFGDRMEAIFVQLQTMVSNYAGWFLILSVNVFVIFSFIVAFSKFGKIRLGGKDAQPEFSTAAWFAMLFSAGMGIGLLFFSVAEPVFHFTNPPVEVTSPAEAANNAFKFTYLHWGFHAWAIYAVVGLSLAFFCFNRNQPLTIRSVFYPLFGERIHGPIGNTIDVLAVVATLFGLATSLGYGVKQVGAGLEYLVGWENTVYLQVILITVITLAATTSVVLGLDKGVRVLSEMNMRLGLLFLVLVLLIGPTLFIINGFLQNTGAYLQEFFSISTWGETYTETNWQNAWTLLYWAWWISWSPYVGMFIARVSRGRTVREFILGVILAPTLLTFFWMGTFGGTAIFMELEGIGDIAAAVNASIDTALFAMLKEFPLSAVTSLIGIILVTSFFVTSSDSGSLVVDSLTAGGKLDAPVGQRIFWALMEGAVAATLLLGGGLTALQAGVQVTGLPFAFLLLIMCYSLWKGLKSEQAEIDRKLRQRERQSYQKTIAEYLAKRKIKEEQKSS